MENHDTAIERNLFTGLVGRAVDENYQVPWFRRVAFAIAASVRRGLQRLHHISTGLSRVLMETSLGSPQIVCQWPLRA